MSTLDDLTARVRVLNAEIAAVERAAVPVDEIVGERLAHLTRAGDDFRRAPFRLPHGNAAAMIERHLLGMMATYFPDQTRDLVEQAARASALPGLRMPAAERDAKLTQLRQQRRIAEARLEQHRREREAAGAEVMARTGDPAVYLLIDSDLARAIAGLPPEEIVPPNPDNPGGADVFGASAGHI